MRSIVFVCFAGSLLAGCSSDAVSPCPLNCPDAADEADTGMPDAGGDVVVPSNCDLAKDPAFSPACIDDGIGVFVDASSGDDMNAGTKAKPFKTIGKAVQSAG